MSFPSERFCRFWTVGLLLASILLGLDPTVGFAETEVQGEVSGVWDAEGSPYIVVDSMWVAENDSLDITAGVDVLFSAQTGLHVFGILSVEGRANDSVRVRLLQDSTTWKGLRFYGRNRVTCNYLSIIAPDNMFYLDEGYTFTANHCNFITNGRLVWNLINNNRGVMRCDLSFTECNVSSNYYFTTSGGRVTIRYSNFDFSENDWDEPGFHSEGTSFIFLRSEIKGSLVRSSGSSIIDSCRWLGTPNDPTVGVTAAGRSGRMTETYVEGSAGAFWSGGAVIPFINNNILNNGGFGECSARIEGCSFGGRLLISECDEVEIKHTMVNGTFWVRNSGSVRVDSSYFIQLEGEDHRINIQNTEFFIMTRSVIKNNFVTSWNVTEIQYDHNTFLFLDSDNIGGVIGTIPSAFTENIIMALPSARQLFSWSDGDELPPGFTYNCIYGFESYGGYGNHLIMEIDSSNVVADPLLVWDYFEPYLSAFSPCIDRADPDSPLDPDSTRSDIGASWFDQSHWINENTLLSSTPMLEISAYPIPFNSYLKIDYSIPAHKPAVFSLIDINGRRIWQDIVMPNNSGSGNLFLDSRNLPSGNYIFIVTTENQQQSLIVNCLK